eukprot:gene2803-biopygen15645
MGVVTIGAVVIESVVMGAVVVALQWWSAGGRKCIARSGDGWEEWRWGVGIQPPHCSPETGVCRARARGSMTRHASSLPASAAWRERRLTSLHSGPSHFVAGATEGDAPYTRAHFFPFRSAGRPRLSNKRLDEGLAAGSASGWRTSWFCNVPFPKLPWRGKGRGVMVYPAWVALGFGASLNLRTLGVALF